MTFLTNLEVTEILRIFRFVLEGKTCKEIPESSRLELLVKFFWKMILFYFTRIGTFSTFNNPFEIQSIFSVGKSEKNKDFYELTAQAV